MPRLESSAALRAADRLLERYAREFDGPARNSAGEFEIVASEAPIGYVYVGLRQRATSTVSIAFPMDR